MILKIEIVLKMIYNDCHSTMWLKLGFFLAFFPLFLFCFALGVVLGSFFLWVLLVFFFRLCYVRSTIFRLYGDVNVVGKEAARIRPVLGTSMHPQQGENTCCQFFVVSFEAKD